MKFSRREFIRDGVAAFTVSFAAPAFLSDIALAQGVRSRNLVVLYLSGGNDSLSTVIPYQDPFYFSRRPAIAIPAGQVLQIGTDGSGKAIGLHPRLGGLRTIFNDGRLAVIQRRATPTRAARISKAPTSGVRPIRRRQLPWGGSAVPRHAAVAGRSARRLECHTGNATGTDREIVSVPAIADSRTYSLSSPNGAAEAVQERNTALRMSSNSANGRPHLSFVNGTVHGALDTLDRVNSVNSYVSSVTYPNNGLALALRTVAGSIVRGIGTKVYWVQFGGIRHALGAGQRRRRRIRHTDADNWRQRTGLLHGPRNQGLLNDTLLLQFSEFGRESPRTPARVPITVRPAS
jgi:hypothetical protein